jgi:zinc D-Ala-D-Ala carboxypeptidase
LYVKLRALKFIKFTTYNLDLKYFNLSEFDSPDEVGSGNKMDSKFLEKLDYARHNAGIPFKINSGYRTKEHNLKVGGRIGSSHLKGLAADIAYNGSRERYIILNALISVGINRLGIGKSFIHCDIDNSKDQDVIWLYN